MTKEGTSIEEYKPVYKWFEDTLYVKTPCGNTVEVSLVDPELTFSLTSELFLHDTGAQFSRPVKNPITVILRPSVVKILRYSSDECMFPDPMYPESTGHWYTRLDRGLTLSVFFIQEVLGTSRQLLTIISMDGMIHECHFVQPYEGEALIPSPRGTQYHEAETTSDETIATLISSLLDIPAPSWSDLYTLVDGITIPPLHDKGLKLKATMDETLDPLIPPNWSPKVRRSAKAFLSFIIKKDESILEEIYDQPVMELLRQPSWFRNLVTHYDLFAFERSRYVQCFWDFERDQNYTHYDPHLPESWPDWTSFYNVLYKDHGYNPEIARYILEFKNRTEIPYGLPITQAEAKRSKRARIERYNLRAEGFYVLGRVNYNIIGLRHMVYVGKAHRWPHRHLEYSIDIKGEANERYPAKFHSIVLPPTAQERILRVRSQLQTVTWYFRTTNPRLFNFQSSEWRVDPDKVLDSLSGSTSKKSIIRSLGVSQRQREYTDLTENEIRVLDLVTTYLYIRYLEDSEFCRKNWGLEPNDIVDTLNHLARKGVVEFLFDAHESLTKTFLVFLKGEEGSILSFIKYIARNMPRSSVYSLDGGEEYVVFLKCPNSIATRLVEELPARAAMSGVMLRLDEPLGTSNYRIDLFTRLWNGEQGCWDENVTALLSQIRSVGSN